MGLDRPDAVDLLDGEELGRVADSVLDLAAQTELFEDRAERNRLTALEHILQRVVCKLDRVEGEAVGLDLDGLVQHDVGVGLDLGLNLVGHDLGSGDRLGNRQRLDSGLTVVVLDVVVDLGLELFLRNSLGRGQRKADLDALALGGLELNAVFILYLEVKGVGDRRSCSRRARPRPPLPAPSSARPSPHRASRPRGRCPPRL